MSISYTLSLKNCADRFLSSITEAFLYHVEEKKLGLAVKTVLSFLILTYLRDQMCN